MRMIMCTDLVELHDLGHRTDDTPRLSQQLPVLVDQAVATAVERGLEREYIAQLLHDLQLPAE
eukprot:7011777-Heterocapsa_arctica.AAC.1